MRTSTKITAVVAGGALVVATAGVAYAYWTTNGSGDGSASTAAAAASVTVVQTSSVSNLSPGSTAQALSGNFNNPNAGTVKVSSISVDFTGTSFATGCSASDYTLVAPTTVSATIPTGNAQGSWSGGTIAMNNLGSDQSACKGQALVLHYVAS